MKCLVLGGTGFIGAHLAYRLKEEGNYVVVADIKKLVYWDKSEICNEFIIGDLRDPEFVDDLLSKYQYDEVYQLAADMGGASYIFTGEHDADIMHNSSLINLNISYEAVKNKVGRLFYSSSACVYPGFTQENEECVDCCREDRIYPAQPDSEYGWEKLFSERLYKAFERNYGLSVRIARYHNVFGPKGTWRGGKEKAPSAICRKVAEERITAPFISRGLYHTSPSIDIWGNGNQTRSFLYIDECVEATIRLMRSECTEIINIGSEEIISINDLAKMTIGISGKNLTINNISGPVGVRGRNSHNALIYEKLEWKPTKPLKEGITALYNWIEEQVNKYS